MLPTCGVLELADSRLLRRSTWRDIPTLKLWPKRGDPLVVPTFGLPLTLWLKRGETLVVPAFGLPLKLWLKPPTGRWPERTPAGATIVSQEDGENAGDEIGATHTRTRQETAFQRVSYRRALPATKSLRVSPKIIIWFQQVTPSLRR